MEERGPGPRAHAGREARLQAGPRATEQPASAITGKFELATYGGSGETLYSKRPDATLRVLLGIKWVELWDLGISQKKATALLKALDAGETTVAEILEPLGFEVGESDGHGDPPARRRSRRRPPLHRRHAVGAAADGPCVLAWHGHRGRGELEPPAHERRPRPPSRWDRGLCRSAA